MCHILIFYSLVNTIYVEGTTHPNLRLRHMPASLINAYRYTYK